VPEISGVAGGLFFSRIGLLDLWMNGLMGKVRASGIQNNPPIHSSINPQLPAVEQCM
jgi:hypothetical protein